MNQQTTRPQTATEFLDTAASTLGERGKQYDPAGKQERSMTAIVAAFNAIYPRNPLTVHMGWQFMCLVKMVRGATKPHADSALDQVAYAALAAEEVAEQLHSQAQLREAYAHNPYAGKAAVERKQEAEVDATMKRIRAGYKGCPQCGADVDKEAGSCQCGWEFEEQEEVQPTAAKRVEQVLAGQAKHEAQVAELTAAELTDKLAAQQELLTVAQHNANFYFDKTNGCIAANESMTAKFQAERKANVAMHEEVTRLRGKVQELADLANYRDKRNMELCAELELLRRSHTTLANASKEYKDALVASTRARLNAQEQVTRLKAEATEARKRGSAGYNKQVAIQAELKQRNKELEDKVQSLNNEVETKVRELMSNMSPEAPCAHNTDEPKAPRTEYVDPFDCYGDIRSPMHRLVGDRDPARGGLAYPNGKPL